MSENYTTDGHTITPEDATANATASGRRSIFITGAAVRFALNPGGGWGGRGVEG